MFAILLWFIFAKVDAKQILHYIIYLKYYFILFLFKIKLSLPTNWNVSQLQEQKNLNLDSESVGRVKSSYPWNIIFFSLFLRFIQQRLELEM